MEEREVEFAGKRFKVSLTRDRYGKDVMMTLVPEDKQGGLTLLVYSWGEVSPFLEPRNREWEAMADDLRAAVDVFLSILDKAENVHTGQG